MWPRHVKVREVTMSTPIRHAKHIDRERDLVPTEPSALAAVNSDRGSAPREPGLTGRSQRYNVDWHLIRNGFRNHHNPNLTADLTGQSRSRPLAFWVWRQSSSGSWCRSLAPACCLKAILCGRVFWGLRSRPIRQSNFQKRHCRTRRNQEICKNRGADST